MQRDGAGDVLVKRLTLQGGQIFSTAGNVIAVNATNLTAANVQSVPATEWASFAARYQQFRVRSVRVIMEPTYPGSGTPVAASVSHGTFYVGDFIGSAVPTTAAQVLSDEGVHIYCTSQRVDYMVDWTRNPNAKLWNPTSAALPVANSYGIAYASNSAATCLAASTTFYSYTVEWIVEFRGAQ